MKLLVKQRSVEHMEEIRKQTIKKWEKLGFLDDLNDTKKVNVALLLESEARQLIPKENNYNYLLIRK